MNAGGVPDDAPAPTFTLRTIGPEPDGATPLDEEDLAGLLADWVATRGDLDQAEFDNISKAMPWATDQARRGGPPRVLDFGFLFTLHRRMFEDVWRWAGNTRRSVTNIGADPAQIVTLTKQALDDAVWWHDHDVFDPDERALRIHRRLVAVHPFRNGNGRCTRLLADLYLTSMSLPVFTWGVGGTVAIEGDIRRAYLAALHAADNDDFAPLMVFARS